MKELGESVSAYLKEVGTHSMDVVKVVIDREFVEVVLYARDASNKRIIDEEFNDYVTYTRKYPMETAWWA